MSAQLRAQPIGALAPVGAAVVTMGVFDGVHAGHRAVLDAARTTALERGARSVALVFDPPPDELLHPGMSVGRLAPLAVNVERIRAAGIDVVAALQFDQQLRGLSAEAFLDALAPAIELRGLVMSRDSAFGRDRGGTVDRMRELGELAGFGLTVVDRVEVDGEVVSSTRIREAIAAGDIAAARGLGVDPYLEGTVVRGAGRGRELGFPTANLRFDYRPALPALGIYAARTTSSAGLVPSGHPALLSIGTRPTFGDDGEMLAEVFLLDFAGDLYSAPLGIEIVARLRDEERFTSVDALVEQMHRDVEAGRNVLAVG